MKLKLFASDKGLRLFLAVVFVGVLVEEGIAQQISGGPATSAGRAMNIYTLSSGGNPGAATTPFVPTNKFGSFGQPAAIVFDPLLPNPNHNASGVLTNPIATTSTVIASEPTAQPTGLLFASVTGTSYTVSFTAASPTPAGYLVLRKEGSAVTASPTDSNLPPVDASLGDALVVSVGSTISIAQSTLTPGTTYFYRIFSYNGSGSTTNYLTTAPLEGSSLEVSPASQPTTFSLSNVANTSLTVSFSTVAGASGYIVLRKSNSAPTSLPDDATAYTAAATLGDATVVHVSSATTFNESSLTPGTEYFYAVYAYIGSGIRTNYLTTGPLTGTSLAAPPTSQPGAFSLSSVAATSLTASFSAGTGADGYIALRKSGSSPASLPTDATTYTVGSVLGDAAVVLFGSAATFNDASLTPGTEYFYAIYSYKGSGITTNYLTTSPLTGTSLSAAPTAQPTSLVFSSVTSTTLTGSYTAASGADGYLVLRKSGSLPTAISANATAYSIGAILGDATIVYSGSALTFDDTSLTPGTNYFYKVFAYKGIGISTRYLTTSPLSGNQVMETAAPTALTFSGFTDTSLSASFTAATSAAGYLAIRKLGSAPTGVPADGTSYAAGATLGDGQVVFFGTGTSFSDTGLTGGASYFYSIYSYTGTTAFNYTSSSPLEGSATTLSAAPSAQPTALVFSNPQPTQLTLSWTANATAPSGYIVLRKVDADPVAVPVGGTAYTAGTALGDATIVYSGASTTFTDLSLTAETIYFYQVMAFNGSGNVINYLTASPLSGSRTTLALQPSAQPYNIQFDNVTTSSLRLSFINSPTTPFPNGYLIIRKVGSAPTSVPFDGTSYAVGSALGDATVVSIGNVISIDQTGLTAGTMYHYLIFAYNGGVGSYNYLTTGPLLGSKQTSSADTTPPTVTSTTAISVTPSTNLLVKADATESGSGSVAGVSLEYRSVAGTTAFTTTPMALTSGTSLNGSWQFTIPAAQIGELGIEYKITAINLADLTATASGITIVSFETSQSLPLSSFGSGVSNYRIVSVPLVLVDKSVNDVFADDLGVYNNEVWRMYRYEGGTTNELNGSSSIEIGKGYWLISKNQASIDFGKGTTASVTNGSPFKIDLVSGWNQIGNPYLFNVLWSDVLTASGGASLTLRTYNGDFVNGTKLNKFEGGFVQVGAATSLTFPVTKNPAAGRSEEIAAQRKINALDNEDWEVRFNLSKGTRYNEFGGVGMNPQAKEEYDTYDDFTLPRFLDYVELNHNKQKAYGMRYTKDIVPTAENFEWEFTIESNIEGTTTMTWDNSYFGKNDKQLVMWDVEENRAIDMRDVSQYMFKGKTGRVFQVFFGNKDYVQQKTELKHLLIHSISPNPTEGETNISFSLSGTEESLVEVKVLNLLGQSIATVYDGKLAGGFHQLTWSGRDNQGNKPAQGVYLVEIIQGKERGSKRLVVK